MGNEKDQIKGKIMCINKIHNHTHKNLTNNERVGRVRSI